MRKYVLIAVAVLVLVIVGGGIVLANWSLPAPTGKIEKPVADDRLAK